LIILLFNDPITIQNRDPFVLKILGTIRNSSQKCTKCGIAVELVLADRLCSIWDRETAEKAAEPRAAPRNGASSYPEENQTEGEGDPYSDAVWGFIPAKTWSDPHLYRGLDNAGKTTIVKKFSGEDVSEVSRFFSAFPHPKDDHFCRLAQLSAFRSLR
jgi:hypothetical protein